MNNRGGSGGSASLTSDALRIVIGIGWLAGAAVNALVTTRMSDPYGWLQDSPVRPYRWFFDDVIGAHPTFWTVMLVIGEFTLAVLTLARGGWARLGLIGGAVFSAFLFLSGLAYTLMMGPYALLLVWLARKEFTRSAPERIRDVAGHQIDRSRPPV